MFHKDKKIYEKALGAAGRKDTIKVQGLWTQELEEVIVNLVEEMDSEIDFCLR